MGWYLLRRAGYSTIHSLSLFDTGFTSPSQVVVVKRKEYRTPGYRTEPYHDIFMFRHADEME
jgi:hypothetical protein